MTDDELRLNIESLHGSIHEFFESVQRHDAQIAQLITASRQDGENVRSLARVAEIHERRLSHLEGETE